MIVGFDIQEAMGCLQFCLQYRSAFEPEECEAALLVDATNAFGIA